MMKGMRKVVSCDLFCPLGPSFLIAHILFIPELIGFAQHTIPHNFLNAPRKRMCL